MLKGLPALELFRVQGPATTHGPGPSSMNPSGCLEVVVAEEHRQLVLALALNDRNQPGRHGGFAWDGTVEFYAKP